jgi:hypothetical protein
MNELSYAALLALATCLGCGGLAEGTETDAGPPIVDSATLYLNFEGTVLAYGGQNDAAAGITTLGDGPGPYQIARPPLSRFVDGAAPTRALVIEEIAQQVRAIYRPFELEVVTQRPANGEFTMLAVGNGFGEIQFAEPCPLAGLAVRDCSGERDGDVGFAAASCVPEQYTPRDARRYLARTIAHEAGHTFGLTHNENQTSIMSPSSAGLSLSKGAVPTKDQASCNRTTQDDFAILRQVLGLRGDV